MADAQTLRRFMPFLMRGRNESAVYFEQRLDLSRTLAFIEAASAEGAQVSFFQIVVAAMVRVLDERPMLNRFVVGRRLYQRRDIALSFAIKKAFEDQGGLTTTKIVFEPGDDLEAVGRRMREAISEGRSDRMSTSDKEMRVLSKLPRFMLEGLMGLQRWLDHHNLLPGAMITPDPLYASVFLANLGSVGLDAPYHHLYEYGTVPIFAAIGRIKKAPWVDEEGQLVVREVVDIRYTLDERIADGFYCARSLERFKALIEDPGAWISNARDI